MRLRYLLFALPIIGTSAYADGVGHVQLQQVPVTANPLKLSNDEMVKPIQIYNGEELSRLRDSSLGATLNGTPGVSNSVRATAIRSGDGGTQTKSRLPTGAAGRAGRDQRGWRDGGRRQHSDHSELARSSGPTGPVGRRLFVCVPPQYVQETV